MRSGVGGPSLAGELSPVRQAAAGVTREQAERVADVGDERRIPEREEHRKRQQRSAACERIDRRADHADRDDLEDGERVEVYHGVVAAVRLGSTRSNPSSVSAAATKVIAPMPSQRQTSAASWYAGGDGSCCNTCTQRPFDVPA